MGGQLRLFVPVYSGPLSLPLQQGEPLDQGGVEQQGGEEVAGAVGDVEGDARDPVGQGRPRAKGQVGQGAEGPEAEAVPDVYKRQILVREAGAILVSAFCSKSTCPVSRDRRRTPSWALSISKSGS